MDLKEIQNRNYQATVKRGLITDKTTIADFVEKIYEEVHEAFEPLYMYHACDYFELNEMSEDMKKDTSIEIADIIITCLCMSKHYDIDIQKYLEGKTLYNEQRTD